MIKRRVYPQLLRKLQSGKVVVLYGSRRVGKTVLLNQLKKDLQQKESILMLNGESRVVQDNFSSQIPEKLSRHIGMGTTLLIIDEAQKIPDIGINLKIIVDSRPDLKVLVSGSASFDLVNKVGEPLTGRQKNILLFPIAVCELIEHFSLNTYQEQFQRNLIYGSYPELFSLSSDREIVGYLHDLVDAYLIKDILELEHVKNSRKVRDLLVLLAFQIGKEVSLSELGNRLDLHKNTVARYLDLLEKNFVIKNIRAFSRNLRNEISKTSRYYFYDNGIRNALINNFNLIPLRDDIGQLWENYLVMERIKKQVYEEIYSNNYFWRTYQQKEIDWIEERDGKLFGFELKWGVKPVKAPKEWLKAYPHSTFTVINPSNYLEEFL